MGVRKSERDEGRGERDEEREVKRERERDEERVANIHERCIHHSIPPYTAPQSCGK